MLEFQVQSRRKGRLDGSGSFARRRERHPIERHAFKARIAGQYMNGTIGALRKHDAVGDGTTGHDKGQASRIGMLTDDSEQGLDTLRRVNPKPPNQAIGRTIDRDYETVVAVPGHHLWQPKELITPGRSQGSGVCIEHDEAPPHPFRHHIKVPERHPAKLGHTLASEGRAVRRQAAISAAFSGARKRHHAVCNAIPSLVKRVPFRNVRPRHIVPCQHQDLGTRVPKIRDERTRIPACAGLPSGANHSDLKRPFDGHSRSIRRIDSVRRDNWMTSHAGRQPQ